MAFSFYAAAIMALTVNSAPVALNTGMDAAPATAGKAPPDFLAACFYQYVGHAPASHEAGRATSETATIGSRQLLCRAQAGDFRPIQPSGLHEMKAFLQPASIAYAWPRTPDQCGVAAPSQACTFNSADCLRPPRRRAKGSAPAGWPPAQHGHAPGGLRRSAASGRNCAPAVRQPAD